MRTYDCVKKERGCVNETHKESTTKVLTNSRTKGGNAWKRKSGTWREKGMSFDGASGVDVERRWKARNRLGLQALVRDSLMSTLEGCPLVGGEALLMEARD